MNINFLPFIRSIFQCSIENHQRCIRFACHDAFLRHHNSTVLFGEHDTDNGVAVGIGLLPVLFFLFPVGGIVRQPTIASTVGLIIIHQCVSVQFFRSNTVQFFHSFDIHPHHSEHRGTVDGYLVCQLRSIEQRKNGLSLIYIMKCGIRLIMKVSIV